MFEFLFKYSRPDYARSELVYLGDWPAWLLYALLLAALALVVTGLYRHRSRARWYQLAAIGGLQVLVAALVVWALGEPSLATERLRDGENTVALVLDTSESMALGEPESRFRQAEASLAAALDNDAPSLVVRHYEMGGSARAVESFAG
ncbi:MAG: hypothetical protein OEV41_12435, partial [Gammaproteobacteria bacterium]|nr:hypothetical protein [Gammaproteobacteria bacterium]